MSKYMGASQATGLGSSKEPEPSGLGPTGAIPSAWRLPIGAGVCAYDRDECTVTFAFDTEADVLAIVESIPHRNRVRLCSE